MRPATPRGLTAFAPCRRTCRRVPGFTLLELLVVMVIAGIVISLVAVNASPNERGRVLDDGQRIARLFELAQEDAQLGARPIAWEGDAGAGAFSNPRHRAGCRCGPISSRLVNGGYAWTAPSLPKAGAAWVPARFDWSLVAS
jgi:prepilin-type N-terminal cleavage/methylation domain-containing protein